MRYSDFQDRIPFIDTAKALLIVLVVIGHVLIVLNPHYDLLYYTAVQAFISTFHMQAFFLITGVLFNYEKWSVQPVRVFILNRVTTLLVPYIVFEMMGAICHMLIRGDTLNQCVYRLITIRCNIGADWFLPAMFIGSLLMIINVKIHSRKYEVLSVVIAFVLPMILPNNNQWSIVAVRGLLAYGFIVIGFVGKYLFMSDKLKNVYLIFACGIATAAVAIIDLKCGTNDFYLGKVSNPVTLLAGGICGVVMIFGVSRWIGNSLLTIIGKNTLIIMGTHQIVIYVMKALVHGTPSFIHGVIVLLAIAVSEIVIVIMYKRIQRAVA